jgi:hypothetical protein
MAAFSRNQRIVKEDRIQEFRIQNAIKAQLVENS